MAASSASMAVAADVDGATRHRRAGADLSFGVLGPANLAERAAGGVRPGRAVGRAGDGGDRDDQAYDGDAGGDGGDDRRPAPDGGAGSGCSCCLLAWSLAAGGHARMVVTRWRRRVLLTAWRFGGAKVRSHRELVGSGLPTMLNGSA